MEGKISMFMMKSSLFQNFYNPRGDQLSNLYSTGSAGGISTRCQQKFVERFSSSAVLLELKSLKPSEHYKVYLV